jgi:hypothetical protein
MGSPAGGIPRETPMSCETCQAEMCTTGGLSKLRCAECRQLTFERDCDVMLDVGLATCVGAALFCLLSRWVKGD